MGVEVGVSDVDDSSSSELIGLIYEIPSPAGFSEDNNQLTEQCTSTTVEKTKFSCPIEKCQRSYTTRGNLKTHMKTHFGQYSFVCEEPGCGKAFLTSFLLARHYVSVHTGSRQFACDHNNCNKSFSTLDRLRTHQRMHSGDIFMCVFNGCTRTSTSSVDLFKHMRTHTDERPYQCTVEGCGRAFHQSQHCRAHILSHQHSHRASGRSNESSHANERIQTGKEQVCHKKPSSKTHGRHRSTVPPSVGPPSSADSITGHPVSSPTATSVAAVSVIQTGDSASSSYFDSQFSRDSFSSSQINDVFLPVLPPQTPSSGGLNDSFSLPAGSETDCPAHDNSFSSYFKYLPSDDFVDVDCVNPSNLLV